MAFVLAIGATAMNLSFLVGILVVLAIILIAVVILAVYRFVYNELLLSLDRILAFHVAGNKIPGRHGPQVTHM